MRSGFATGLVFFLIIFSTRPYIYPDENNNDLDNEDHRYDRELLIRARDKFISENGDLLVNNIQVSGLKNTKESVVLNEAGIVPGMKLSSFDPHRFINRLKKKNIFTDMTIVYTLENNTVIIRLYLHEKWTLIPIPMFYSNSDTTVYGIFFLESNFLGYAKTLFTGISYSDISKSAVFGFIDPSIRGTGFTGNLYLTYKNNIERKGTMNKSIFSEYKARFRKARIDSGYTFSENIRIYLSEVYDEGIVDEGYSDSLNAPESMRYIMTGTVMKLDFLKYYEYLYYGFKAEMKYYMHSPIDPGKKYSTLDYKMDYSHKIFNFHRITLFSAGSTGNKPAVLEETISGTTGTRTLPPDIISADNYYNYSVVYEYPFYRFSRGAVMLLCLWEHGIYNRDDSGFYDYYGPGGGILLYLKRIAFPAVGFNYALNLKTNNGEFSVNIGFSF
jgi:hypothetical protein